jgi:hypothetical protein
LVWVAGVSLATLCVAGCGSDDYSGEVYVDAQFDPATSSDISRPIHEANPAVAQSFVVEREGKLEEFWFIVTDGESVDDGVVRVTVRPANAMGEPDADPDSSIIDPFDVDTSSLPATLVETFSVFFVGNDTGRKVDVGERYAIVVEFVSRNTNTDANAIARVLGQFGDSYASGTGSVGESGVGFMSNTDDYFFRTFVLAK